MWRECWKRQQQRAGQQTTDDDAIWGQFFKATRRLSRQEGVRWNKWCTDKRACCSVCVCVCVCVCVRVSVPAWIAAWLDANNPSPWRHSSGFVRALHRWLDWLEGTVWESKPNNHWQLRSSPCFPVTSSLFPPNVACEKTWRCVCVRQQGFSSNSGLSGALLERLIVGYAGGD